MALAEFVYTTICKPPWLKALVNRAILALLPEKIKVGEATIVLNPRDPVVSGALAFGVYEKAEIAFMQQLLGPGQVILDIGANLGLYTALAGQAVGTQGRVIAFEPDPECLTYLYQTINANQLDNVDVVEAAASNVEGRANLYISSINRGDNRLYQNQFSDTSLDIKTVLIDQVLKAKQIDRVDVVKIDVQGFEGQVIESMQQTLRQSANIKMLVEFWPEGLRSAGTEPTDFLTGLQDLGLSIFELGSGGNILSIGDFARFIESYPGRKYTNLVVIGPDADLSSQVPPA